jgi:hypothetical protein
MGPGGEDEGGFQSQLNTGRPVYPDRLHGGDEEAVYRLLGVDQEDRGHYWLQSDKLHSVIYSVDEGYEVESVKGWETDDIISEYVESVSWWILSEYGSDLLELCESGED